MRGRRSSSGLPRLPLLLLLLLPPLFLGVMAVTGSVVDGSKINEPWQHVHSESCDEQCRIHEDFRRIREEDIKRKVLEALGKAEPPLITDPPSPEMIQRALERNQVPSDAPYAEPDGSHRRLPKDATMAVLTKKFVFPARDLTNKTFSSNPLRTHFNLDNMREYEITNATHYFYLSFPQSLSHLQVLNFNIHLYKYVDATNVDAEPMAVLSKKLNWQPGIWESYNATELVAFWAKNPHKNYGLMIKAEVEGVDVVLRHGPGAASESASHETFLEIQVKENLQKLSSARQPVADCSELDNERKCCRYPFEVDFESFQWDWIIAPKRYNAFYCAGECPLRYLHSNSHSYLTRQIEAALPESQKDRTIGPCCTPHYMSEIQIIYYDEYRQIITRKIPDMVVQRCSCA